MKKIDLNKMVELAKVTNNFELQKELFNLENKDINKSLKTNINLSEELKEELKYETYYLTETNRLLKEGEFDDLEDNENSKFYYGTWNYNTSSYDGFDDFERLKLKEVDCISINNYDPAAEMILFEDKEGNQIAMKNDYRNGKDVISIDEFYVTKEIKEQNNSYDFDR